MNDVDAWSQLIASVTADGVGTATVKPLIGRYVTHLLSRELNVAGQNRATTDAPGKHGAASDRIVFRDLEFTAIELVGRLRADQRRRMQQRHRADTALGRFENAVGTVAHEREGYRSEVPAILQESAAGFVAQPEQNAVNPLFGHRSADRITVAQRRRKPAARVERDIRVAANRLARVHVELGAALGHETQ